MPILTKLKKDKTIEIPQNIKSIVQSRLFDHFSEFDLPRFHDIVLSRIMLNKAIEDDYILPFLEKDAIAYVDTLVRKTVEYTSILDSQDKLPELIHEYIVLHGSPETLYYNK